MKLRVGLCQVVVGARKADNYASAAAAIAKAVAARSQLVVLPECWNSPYGTSFFAEYSEPVPQGPSTQHLREWAKQSGVYIVGGSIPERAADGKLFNTSVVVNPHGDVVATHRKVHLFDVNVPGGICFTESETLTAGNDITVFAVDIAEGSLRVGLGICYDIRFAELAMLMAREGGASLLVYPGAFNMTTGPLHWELLARARALDNQLFVCAVSPARDTAAAYHAWGHSMAVDPWGRIVGELDEKPEVLCVELDFAQVAGVRQAIPITKQRRVDMYNVARVVPTAQ